ncbi:MAG TPA: hypothetical protein DCM68_05965 [Verrucomicrobia bacterium]|nr:hypothetical protein [Verrucomicrobiota bacterium]
MKNPDVMPIQDVSAVRRVLVYSIGSLGDTLCVLPALWAVRQHFANARISLLVDAQRGRSLVSAREVLEGCGCVDEFLSYPVSGNCAGKASLALHMFRVVYEGRYDVLVYLVRCWQGQWRVLRDRLFFASTGIPARIGFEGLPVRPPITSGVPPPRLPPVADLLLARLRASGVPAPAAGEGRYDLALTVAERAEAQQWLEDRGAPQGRPLLGVGPGSKMPSKIWPVERFGEAVKQLIAETGVWPVVSGGGDDRELGDRLVATWGEGTVAAGGLGVRQSAALLSRCAAYLGNDTGTMHLAAAVGVPCVGVFSARDYPGLWEPYGAGHIVLRHDLSCSGCMAQQCPGHGNECTRRVGVEDVVAACSKILKQRRGGTKGIEVVNGEPS